MSAEIGSLIRRCGVATAYADWKKLTAGWAQENNKVPSTSDSEHNVRGKKIFCHKHYYPWSPVVLHPLTPMGSTPLNDRISVVCRAGHCKCFCGVEPVFQHGESDHSSFRMFTSQLVCQGACKQIEILKAFGVTATLYPTLDRTVRCQNSSLY